MKNKKVKLVKTEGLKPDPGQPRETFNEELLRSQGESYKEHGIINPIEIDEDSMIITGERRWRAAKLVNLAEVPVIVLKGLSPDQKLARQACENFSRVPLTGREQVKTFKRIYAKVSTSGHLDKGGKQPNEKYIRKTARFMGISKTWAYELYHLAFDTPEPLIKDFEKGKLPITVLPEIRRVKDKNTEIRLGKKIAKEKMRVHDVRSVAGAISKHPEKTNELLDEVYVGGHDTVVAQINEIVKPKPKKREITKTEKQIDTQADFVQKFLTLSSRVISTVLNMKEVEFGLGNLQIIQKAMANMVDSFNDFSDNKSKIENGHGKQLEGKNVKEKNN